MVKVIVEVVVVVIVVVVVVVVVVICSSTSSLKALFVHLKGVGASPHALLVCI